MEEKSKVIFGNVMSDKVYKSAVKSKKKFIKKFGDDSNVDYPIYIQKNEHIGDSLGVYDILLKEGDSPEEFDHEKGIIVGNIRMGFGHYRISMAMASAAKAMGYTPYWMDLNGYPQTTCTKVISAQNDLYSLGSRLSKKHSLTNWSGSRPTRDLPSVEVQCIRSEECRTDGSGLPQCAKGYPGDRYTRMAGTGSHSCRHEKRCQCHS